jgi:tetratricopeptide (TPR) repeat protein
MAAEITPIDPAKRRRLQQTFEHANKSATQGNFDYATEMFTQCVLGDPGNRMYALQFLNNLFKKYNNNKKGSKMASISGMGHKGSIKKASMSKDWPGVIKAGLEMLKLNPWDTGTLMAMADACDSLEMNDSQLVYLKTALDANPKDADINRRCGKALAQAGAFDQAIICWTRVSQAKPGDPEALKAIANLNIEKTIHKGGYEGAESSRDVKQRNGDDEPRAGERVVTPEERLEKQIAKNPTDLNNYVELADLHTRADRMQQAEEVLAKALEVSSGDMMVRERHEDAQLRRGRQQLLIAEKRAASEGTEEAVELAKQMKAELNRLEIDVYRSRVDRYPTNLTFKYELGMRLKQAGQFQEAIQLLQQARGDTKRKAQVHVDLGECFQHIKQFKLALNNYKDAVESLSDHSTEIGKLALYRAGVIAYHLKDRELAEKFLTELAGIDFGYRDVSKWLDKMSQEAQNG